MFFLKSWVIESNSNDKTRCEIPNPIDHRKVTKLESSFKTKSIDVCIKKRGPH